VSRSSGLRSTGPGMLPRSFREIAMNRRPSEDTDRTVRLDKWLWAARFYKTRSLAQQAIDGGKVYVGENRAKASRSVEVGMEIHLTLPRGEMVVVVEGVSDRRGPASVATTLYRETDESKRRREELAETNRFSFVAAPAERPNSQDRKALRRIKEGGK
jgi:ribosome-associated heat shock protein Hsp15